MEAGLRAPTTWHTMLHTRTTGAFWSFLISWLSPSRLLGLAPGVEAAHWAHGGSQVVTATETPSPTDSPRHQPGGKSGCYGLGDWMKAPGPKIAYWAQSNSPGALRQGHLTVLKAVQTSDHLMVVGIIPYCGALLAQLQGLAWR
jgi:hypothetical protein